MADRIRPREGAVMSDVLESSATLRDRVESLRLPSAVDDPRGAGRTGWLPWALCLLLAAGTASLAVRVYTGNVTTGKAPAGDNPTPSAAAPPAAGEAPKSAAKPVAPLAAGALVLESKGYIIPAHLIQVSPIEVGGRVTELFVEEGKRFKKGEILAVLDHTGYE